MLAFKKYMSFHTGTDTDANIRRTIAAKQKKRPGTAGEAIVFEGGGDMEWGVGVGVGG
jgi:hypothetical protein